MAFRLFDKVTSIGASRAVKLNLDIGVKDHTVHVSYSPTDVTAVSALTISLQGSYSNKDASTGVITPAGLALGTGNTNKNLAIGTAFNYLLNDTNYSAAAVAAGVVFSAAHVIGNGTAGKFGAVNVYIDSSGVLQTIVPGAQTVTPQLYTTAALAFAAAADWVRGTDYPLTYCPVGRLIISCDSKTWTANSSNLTPTSGLTSIQYVSFASTFKDIVTYTFTDNDLTNMGAMFSFKGSNPKWVRLFLSVLTGSAQVSARYMPEDSA